MHKMKKISLKINKSIIRLSCFSVIAIILNACTTERGGVAIDASGEKGGGTQPGGGGLGFVILFLVVTVIILGIFAMDRIKRSKESKKSNNENDE